MAMTGCEVNTNTPSVTIQTLWTIYKIEQIWTVSHGTSTQIHVHFQSERASVEVGLEREGCAMPHSKYLRDCDGTLWGEAGTLWPVEGKLVTIIELASREIDNPWWQVSALRKDHSFIEQVFTHPLPMSPLPLDPPGTGVGISPQTQSTFSQHLQSLKGGRYFASMTVQWFL